MKTSSAGVAFIRRHEGAVLSAYRDPVGVLTIGVGHTSAAGPPVVKPGMKITLEEADAILKRDLARFEESVSRLVKVPLSQPQFDALVSFTFNLGEGNLSRSTLLKKLNAGDYLGAANEFQKWNKAGGKVLKGLVKRRAEEADLFLSGFGQAPPAAPPPDIDPPPEPPAEKPKSIWATILDFILSIFRRRKQ